MRFNHRILGTMALAAIGACMAHAQYQGFAAGYVSASYSETAWGIYATATGGEYSWYSSSSMGTGWAEADYQTSVPGQNVYADGYSYAAGIGGFTGMYSSYGSITFTNVSQVSDTLVISVLTEGEGYAYASDANGYGEGDAEGIFEDETGAIYQSSEGVATSGYKEGVFSYWINYDPYNGITEGDQIDGYTFPSGIWGSTEDQELYDVALAPGQSDTFYTTVVEDHQAYGGYSTTPGPGAVAPFALGLIGALRRRAGTRRSR